MRLFCVLLLTLLGWTTLAGCGGSPAAPQKMTAEQQKEYENQAQKVQDEEQRHNAQQTSKK